MITAGEANMIAHRMKGYSFNIEDREKEQIHDIEKMIEQIANNGGYTMFYDEALYDGVRAVLINHGYVVRDIYEYKREIKVYIGVSIEWC